MCTCTHTHMHGHMCAHANTAHRCTRTHISAHAHTHAYTHAHTQQLLTRGTRRGALGVWLVPAIGSRPNSRCRQLPLPPATLAPLVTLATCPRLTLVVFPVRVRVTAAQCRGHRGRLLGNSGNPSLDGSGHAVALA